MLVKGVSLTSYHRNMGGINLRLVLVMKTHFLWVQLQENVLPIGQVTYSWCFQNNNQNSASTSYFCAKLF